MPPLPVDAMVPAFRAFVQRHLCPGVTVNYDADGAATFRLAADAGRCFVDPGARFPCPGLTAAQLDRLGRLFAPLWLEKTAAGDVVVRSPRGAALAARAANLSARLSPWALQHGQCFQLAGFVLPDGAIRAPHIAWVADAHCLDNFDEAQDPYLRRCPDFVIELIAVGDNLPDAQQRLRAFCDNGARLGWLLAPAARWAEIWRPGQLAVRLQQPAVLRGDPELPGLTVDLTGWWPEPD